MYNFEFFLVRFVKLKKIKDMLKQNLPKNVFRKKLSFILPNLIDLENATSFNNLHLKKLMSLKCF